MALRTNLALWNTNKKYWQVNVQKNGERRSFYDSTPGPKGQRACQDKADLWLDQNINMAPRGKNLQFYWDSFLSYKKSVIINWKEIESIGRVWLMPNIGRKRPDTLTVFDMQRVLDKAAAKNLSKKTISNIRATLSEFLKYLRMNQLTLMTIEGVKIPKMARLKGKTVLQPDDVLKVLENDTTILRGEEVYDTFVNAYRLSIMLGLRPGELRGLEWSDYDPQEKMLHIRRAINKDGVTTAGKNDNAIRDIKLNELDIACFENQKRFTPPESCKRVFEINSTNGFRSRWHKFCDVHGIKKIAPYEMRHTFVSILKGNMTELMVKMHIGHSASMDTETYSHEIQGDKEKIAEIRQNTFGKIVAANKQQQQQAGAAPPMKVKVRVRKSL